MAATLTAREACMLNIMEIITNKPGWNKMIIDKETVSYWWNKARSCN